MPRVLPAFSRTLAPLASGIKIAILSLLAKLSIKKVFAWSTVKPCVSIAFIVLFFAALYIERICGDLLRSWVKLISPAMKSIDNPGANCIAATFLCLPKRTSSTWLKACCICAFVCSIICAFWAASLVVLAACGKEVAAASVLDASTVWAATVFWAAVVVFVAALTAEGSAVAADTVVALTLEEYVGSFLPAVILTFLIAPVAVFIPRIVLPGKLTTALIIFGAAATNAPIITIPIATSATLATFFAV